MSLPEQLLVLRDAVHRLESLGVPYMATGSLAMNYYAEPRMTRDIDLVVELDSSGVPAFVRSFSGDFHLSEEAVAAAVRDRSLFSSIHVGHVVKVDFIVRKRTRYREQEFKRRRRVDIGGMEMDLVSAEDLILSKLEWHKESGSEVQLRDVKNLVGVVKKLDWSYLEQWAAELSVSATLRQLR